METINYYAKAKALIGHLSGHGYSDSCIGLFRRESERLAEYLSAGGAHEGYLAGYCERYGLKLHPGRLWAIKASLSFFEDGRVPCRRHPLRHIPTSCERLSASNRGLVGSYIASCGSGWSPSTAATVRHTLSAFLLHVQLSGVELSEAAEDVVWSYFYDCERDMPLRGHGTSGAVRRFLRWLCGTPGGGRYRRILGFVPAVKKSVKVSDCLTEEEDRRLVSYILGDGCRLSLRDRAIVTVARFCGLRACDIAALRMEDIDLSRSRLAIRQHKTGQPLEQALRPVVGNAVCRYVTEERPESGLPEVFLVNERDVRPLFPSTVGAVCGKAYRLAGISRDGGRRGSHLLRHRFAQSLIDGGACDSAAMRLLGHTSPASLNVYLETDDRRLRECALSISGFAIGKEVLP